MTVSLRARQVAALGVCALLAAGCVEGQVIGSTQVAAPDAPADTVADTAGEVDTAAPDTAADADVADTALDGDTGATDTAPDTQPGEFLHPCDDNADCFSGFCVEAPEGKVCSKTCEDDSSCPAGWACSQVGEPGDPTFICVPLDTHLCKPCDASEACRTAGIFEDGVCLAAGLGGSFCTRPCGPDATCPATHACQGAQPFGPDGPTVDLCVPLAEDTCACTPRFVELGASTTCYSDSPDGKCPATRACLEVGPLPACNPPTAVPETCNGLDDDCDGETDESAADCTAYFPDTDGDLYGQGAGICSCTLPGAGWVTQGGDCDEDKKAINPGAQEACNGVDDDCDGETDETWPQLGEACDGADSDQCADGTWDCSANGLTTVCVGDDAGGTLETCNGLDDDCDGETDEGNPDGGSTCLVPGLKGECAKGVEQCQGGEVVCVQVVTDVPETCNLKDDDCDGSTDEENPSGGGTCAVPGKVGECAVGVEICVGGQLLCQQINFGVVETCNGKDDDCDGATDLFEQTCTFGCGNGTETCVNGTFQGCDAPAPKCNPADPCCASNGCSFEPSSKQCGTAPVGEQQGCAGGCAGQIRLERQLQFCSGVSAACGFDNLKWVDAGLVQACGPTQLCEELGPTASCKDCPGGCFAGNVCQP